MITLDSRVVRSAILRYWAVYIDLKDCGLCFVPCVGVVGGRVE